MSDDEVRGLSALQTEARDPRSQLLDTLPTRHIVALMNASDRDVIDAVARCGSAISEAVDATYPRIGAGGRLFYIGSGTSGRLGLLDAAEIPPTFSAPVEQFVGLISGGDDAIRVAKEGAEDSPEGAVVDLAAHSLCAGDVVIGVASSGRTPYVLGGLEYARSLGCLTVGVCCVHPSEMLRAGTADHLIAPVTGAEILAGSTRLKAGTATKMVLNTLSTGIMVRLGKTYGNLMVDVKPTNAKLRARARNIFYAVCGISNVWLVTDQRSPQLVVTPAPGQVDEHLAQCNRSLKLAIVVGKTGLGVPDANALLYRCRGNLRDALSGSADVRSPSPTDSEGLTLSRLSSETEPDTEAEREVVTRDSEVTERQTGNLPRWVIVVDGGGSKTTVVIKSSQGHEFVEVAGPTNVATCGVDDMIKSLANAISKAVVKVPRDTLKEGSLKFDSAWVGLAGIASLDKAYYDEAEVKLVQLLDISPSGLSLTGDSALLAAALTEHPFTTSVCLVAGTGCGAMAYERQQHKYQFLGKSGGWGSFLGDEGSGHYVGMEAIKATLAAIDRVRMSTTRTAVLNELHSSVVDTISEGLPADFLAFMISYMESVQIDHKARKARIASLAKSVFDHAFGGTLADCGAIAICSRAAEKLAAMVAPFAEDGVVDSLNTLLVFGGSLVSVAPFQQMVVQKLEERGIVFGGSTFVGEPARVAAAALILDLHGAS